ncbi:MAG: PD-(D/E)XK nuclease family protein, partial [Rhodospirillales bacterium]|nr:PD-(D/E)XK nuclease family protein [Rhodospirillales bacterium]
KQSIYSFQGADPRGFARMHDYFEARARAVGADWKLVELLQSFRTTSAVLTVVDAVFQRPEAQAGVTDETGTRHYAQRRDHAGVVELWPAIQKETTEEPGPWDAPVDRIRASSPMARTTETIAATIDRWLGNKEPLDSKGRPISAGDIMILVPKRGQFAEEMVRRLKARGIPVAGSDRMILSEQIAVMDLMAAARFALLPDDDLTLAVLLKGPFIGLSEDDLFDLAHQRSGTLWRSLKDHAGKGGDDTVKWRTARTSLDSLLAMADFCPPFEFFSRLLGPGHGRRRLLARLGPEANDPIDEFLAQTIAFERDHVSSLQGFLSWFEAGGTDIKRDMDTGRGQVRVMTVHGSKGLEANIVILPDTCSEPASTSRERVLWTTPGDDVEGEATHGPPVSPVPLWPGIKANETEQCTALRDRMKDVRLEEYRRLLYVAMTRARDRLYVMGWERGKRSDKKEHGRDEGSWYELVRPAMAGRDDVEVLAGETGATSETGATGDAGGSDAVYRITTPQTALPETEQAADQITVATPDPPAWLFTAPAPEPEPFQPLSPSRPDGEEPPVMPPFSGDDTSRFRRGNLIHRLLQTLPDLPAPQRRDAALNWLSQAAGELDAPARAAVANETMAVLEASDFVQVFGPDSLPEVAIAGTVETASGPRTIAGQVDRLLITDNTVTIVDYKTNRPPPSRESDVPEAYLRQMALYKSALEHIYPEHVIRCLLVWTDGPHGMLLDNDQLGLYAP